MQTNLSPSWDLLSVMLYVFLGYVGACAIKKSKRKSYVLFRRRGNRIYADLPYLLWWCSWTFVAAFRLVNKNGLGGTDAYAYVNFFKICNGSAFEDSALVLQYAEHYEILYKLLNKVIRLFTGNHQVLFLLVYGFIVWTYQKVIRCFSYENIYAAPFIALFFVYLRSFNTLRTELSAAFILLMTLSLYKDKYRSAILLGIMAIGIQITSALYCLLIPFHYWCRKGKLNTYKVIIMVALSSLTGKAAQILMTGSIGRALGHQYFSYAGHNIGHSFFENFWKIAFGQLLIGLLILAFDRKLKRKMSENGEFAASLQFVREVCLFDVITIPITFILDIWRGYEYLYIMRLLMWSYVTCVFLKGKKSDVRHVVCAVEVVMFTAWLVFRIVKTWEQSGYMPYMLSVFQ